MFNNGGEVWIILGQIVALVILNYIDRRTVIIDNKNRLLGYGFLYSPGQVLTDWDW